MKDGCIMVSMGVKGMEGETKNWPSSKHVLARGCARCAGAGRTILRILFPKRLAE